MVVHAMAQSESKAPTMAQSRFHCNTCQVGFQDIDGLKEHYDGALHKENVRRRVANAPPLTQLQFAKRQSGEMAASTTASRAQYLCTVCDKRFATVQTLRTHLQSQKHKQRKAQQQLQKAEEEAAAAAKAEGAVHVDPTVAEGDDSPTAPLCPPCVTAAPPAPADGEKDGDTAPQSLPPAEASGADSPSTTSAALTSHDFWGRALPEPIGRLQETDELQPGDCLFSNLRFSSIDDSLCYMSLKYGFDLPLFDDISDLGGLMSYLCRKVDGCMCLVCGEFGKAFETRAAAQAHMVACGHTMIRLDDGEYSDFYSRLPPTEPAGDRLERNRETGRVTLPSGKELMPQDAPVQHRKKEMPLLDEVQQKRRQLLIQAKAAHVSVGALEQYRELRAERMKGYAGKAVRAEIKHTVREQNKYLMKLGVTGNKLHKKGYQGDYVGRTM